MTAWQKKSAGNGCNRAFLRKREHTKKANAVVSGVGLLKLLLEASEAVEFRFPLWIVQTDNFSFRFTRVDELVVADVDSSIRNSWTARVRKEDQVSWLWDDNCFVSENIGRGVREIDWPVLLYTHWRKPLQSNPTSVILLHLYGVPWRDNPVETA